MKKFLLLSVIFWGLLFFVIPNKTEAAIPCPSLPPRLYVDFGPYGSWDNTSIPAIAGDSQFENMTIKVPIGISLNFRYRIEAERSSINSVTFPGGSAWTGIDPSPSMDQFLGYQNQGIYDSLSSGFTTKSGNMLQFPGPQPTGVYENPPGVFNKYWRYFNTSILDANKSISFNSINYCTSSGGMGLPGEVRLSVAVQVVPNCVIDSFSCDASSNLSWATSNCTIRNINPVIGAVGVSGTTSGTPGQTYTLSASGQFNNASSLATCPAICNLNSDCDDYNICTTDICNNAGLPTANCSRTNNSAACNDGLWCNGADTCGGGSCSIHTGRDCDDGKLCTNDSCNEATDACDNDVIPGFHKVCSGISCISIANTAAQCTDTCNDDYDCGTPLPPAEFNLDVDISGQGKVVDLNNPGKIDCTPNCNKNYDENTVVTLRATPNPGRILVNWGGSCGGGVGSILADGSQGTCTLAIDGDKTASVQFIVDPDYSEF